MDISLDQYIQQKKIRRPQSGGRGRGASSGRGRGAVRGTARSGSLKQTIAKKILSRSRNIAFGGQRNSRGYMIASKIRQFKRPGSANWQRQSRTSVAQSNLFAIKRQQAFKPNTFNQQRKQRGLKWFLVQQKINRAARNLRVSPLQQQRQQQPQRQYVPQRRQQQYLPQLQVVTPNNRQQRIQSPKKYNVVRNKIQRGKGQQRRLTTALPSQRGNVGSGLRVSIKNELSNRVNRAKKMQHFRNRGNNRGRALPVTVRNDELDPDSFEGLVQVRNRPRNLDVPQAVFPRERARTYFANLDDIQEEEEIVAKPKPRLVRNFLPVATTSFTLDERFSQ